MPLDEREAATWAVRPKWAGRRGHRRERGHRPVLGAPRVAAYAASKGGLTQLTKSLAAAWAQDNIQVNAVLPGWIDTDLTEVARAQIPELHEAVLARTPAGRWGQPKELAGVTVFLAAPAADFVTGAEIVADGAYSMRG